MEDLTKKLKVGDTVYMPLRVKNLSRNGCYSVELVTNGGSGIGFTTDGRYSTTSNQPDIVLSVPEYPKVMEVSASNRTWHKRTVIFENNNGVFAFAESITGQDTNIVVFWPYAREIQPEKERVKLTIQDIADKLGVDAGLIDIIKG